MTLEWVGSGHARATQRRYSMKNILLSFAAVLFVSHPANAHTIGADELLGIIVPGTPANDDNAQVQVNGLLEGWVVPGPAADVLGFNDGALTGAILGNNPEDPKSEVYTLKFSATTVIPTPLAPLATSFSPSVDGSNPTFNLGAWKYDWVLAKWGQDAAVYYIGNLPAGTDVTLSLGGTGFTNNGHELSHYILFNKTLPPPPPTVTSVPDGGSAAALLGSAVVAVGLLRRRFNPCIVGIPYRTWSVAKRADRVQMWFQQSITENRRRKRLRIT